VNIAPAHSILEDFETTIGAASMEIPHSMQAELAAWNNGAGIDLKSWVGCEGRFALAVGYSSIFWPQFVEFEGYVLRHGFSVQSLRGFEQQAGIDRRSVEWLMNHLHIADIQYYGCPDASKDKLILLGNTLTEIYRAKLNIQFPNNPCVVEFYQPDDPDDLIEYQMSFWREQ
jgi:hypothetical protein